jgi:putative transcriptional regulator
MKDRFDWSWADAMTEEERHAAALADPDAQPLVEADIARMRRLPPVRAMRIRFRLSQEEFSARFRIPLGTLRDWEQGRKEPDAAAKAYLTVIARDPDAVTRALETAA